MGLLDQVIGAVAGQMGTQGGNGGANPVMQLVLQLIRNHPGGLQGLIQQFTQAGLGQQAQSWVSTGANLPVSADDLMKVFGGQGGGGLQDIIGRLGIDPQQAMGGLAEQLPGVVDQLTPNGTIEEGDLEAGIGALLNRFR